MEFKIQSKYQPAGDQPKAIAGLIKGVEKGDRYQTLLGVTGSGKTFTAANVIEHVQKPTLVIAHNKTLAAQLAQEYREFFPNNAVSYFVSYYDYYQPEAYMPVTDTYIEKDAQINEEIDRLRHASTQALLTRRDVIVVASVSCIYGLGSPADYERENMKITVGDTFDRREFLSRLVALHYERTTADLHPGNFRSIGGRVEIMPVSEEMIYLFEFSGSTISKILRIDPVSRSVLREEQFIFLFPAVHFLTSESARERAIKAITEELDARLAELHEGGQNLEAERLKRRTMYDVAMIREVGYCSGIENYSRHLSGRAEGEAPDTLLSYFPCSARATQDKPHIHTPDCKPDFLTIIDESHVTLPQIGGMYAGDASRKKTLVEHGFRLPSAKDNRPLKFDEFLERTGQMVFTSATPGNFEKENSARVVEQVIRPTGLVDPEVSVRPILQNGKYLGQIGDFIDEAEKEIKKGFRAIATTLTKKMAEDLSEYLKERKIKAEYLHSDVKTFDRIEILTRFRRGEFDVLVGVNLLREGLDMPEVSFIGILDADKEGFLRSETSLIQTIGRAARNAAGRVILYADTVTGSMERAIGETNRRREIQLEYNKAHGITPKTIEKNIKDITEELRREHRKVVQKNLETDRQVFGKDLKKLIKQKNKEMQQAVKDLDFETAAILRDEIRELEEK
ncbi:MAG TPA: excinuclease ABC subunit UvrB [Candidatus Paceibacterota bacterium]|nr:excinuclease ABC subunit UvrB [Candidatus Paceibacterota bacterium]